MGEKNSWQLWKTYPSPTISALWRFSYWKHLSRHIWRPLLSKCVLCHSEYLVCVRSSNFSVPVAFRLVQKSTTVETNSSPWFNYAKRKILIFSLLELFVSRQHFELMDMINTYFFNSICNYIHYYLPLVSCGRTCMSVHNIRDSALTTAGHNDKLGKFFPFYSSIFDICGWKTACLVEFDSSDQWLSAQQTP